MKGEEFRERREKLGLTRPSAASEIGCATDTVKNWEHGRTKGIPGYAEKWLIKTELHKINADAEKLSRDAREERKATSRARNALRRIQRYGNAAGRLSDG